MDTSKEKTDMVISYLHFARKARGYTDQQLALKLGLTKNNYNKLESGETPLTVEQFFQIADALEFNVHELLDAALWRYEHFRI